MTQLDRNEWYSFLDGALLPLTPVPRTPEGHPAEEALKSYVQWMGGRDVVGVVVGSETARSHRLTWEQRCAVLSQWRQGLSSRQAVVAVVDGPSEVATPDADHTRQFRDAVVKRARRLLKAGADILWPAVPAVCHGRDNETALVLDYYQKLAKLGAPVIAAACGVSGQPHDYALDLYRRLAELDNIVALRVGGCGDVRHQQRLCAALAAELPTLPLVTCEEQSLSYALMLGAKAAAAVLGACCTDTVAELVKTHADRRFHRFHALVPKVEALSRALYAPPESGAVQRVLWALEFTGVIPAEAAFDPAAPELRPEAKSAFRQVLENLGEVAPPPKPTKSEDEELDEFLASRR